MEETFKVWKNTGRNDGSMPNSLVQHIFIDPKNKLWLACDNRDLCRFDPAQPEPSRRTLAGLPPPCLRDASMEWTCGLVRRPWERGTPTVQHGLVSRVHVLSNRTNDQKT